MATSIILVSVKYIAALLNHIYAYHQKLLHDDRWIYKIKAPWTTQPIAYKRLLYSNKAVTKYFNWTITYSKLRLVNKIKILWVYVNKHLVSIFYLISNISVIGTLIKIHISASLFVTTKLTLYTVGCSLPKTIEY